MHKVLQKSGSHLLFLYPLQAFLPEQQMLPPLKSTRRLWEWALPLSHLCALKVPPSRTPCHLFHPEKLPSSFRVGSHVISEWYLPWAPRQETIVGFTVCLSSYVLNSHCLRHYSWAALSPQLDWESRGTKKCYLTHLCAITTDSFCPIFNA